MGLEIAPSAVPTCAVPDRFLFHFGQLMRRKGTFWLLDALEHAFAQEPSLVVVLAGYSHWNELSLALRKLDHYRARLQVLYPLPKPQLYSILGRAEAVVLPSLVDNLPNTAIESLMLGIPVIGTQGASLDELVTPSIHGELVPANDVPALADAMVRFWRSETPVRKGFVWQSETATAMQPENAVKHFLQFANGR
jgi:glycosyltransferase involved in cell wall biosynthesis